VSGQPPASAGTADGYALLRREPGLAAGRLVSWRYDFWLRDDDAGEIPAHASVT